jgi:sugar-specific transcriptional regulator TrmB
MGTSASRTKSIDEAVHTLQELGLKRYEAECFVGLSRLERATAKELARIADVPRTRVYESIRVLDSMRLVDVQHTNPKRFSAVPRDVAITLLRNQYHDRIERLDETLEMIDTVQSEQAAPDRER